MARRTGTVSNPVVLRVAVSATGRTHVAGTATTLFARSDPTSGMDTETVRDLLSAVQDPDLGNDIVSLGLVNDVTVEDGTIHVDLALGAPYSPNETAIADDVRSVLATEAPDYDVDLSATVDRGLDPEDQVLDRKSVV